MTRVKILSLLLICMFLVTLYYAVVICAKEEDGEVLYDEEAHPDPNDEHYDGMIYVGRLHADGVTRVGWHEPNGMTLLVSSCCIPFLRPQVGVVSCNVPCYSDSSSTQMLLKNVIHIQG
jgi:hypothetical protein